ncbi:polysaccharide biosynthesis protein [Clostridium thermobutyricum]|uniref:UDP-N-acetyl-alpha-D-glucosamine C6 dehydratase n=1 Tax=Clostridium thermobutyricum DSM 4928 TaxID=1121339 RepID=A0A1V4SUD3_9CLOT|nr:nucleoside-diphosphate sugar epimerase/dehydratase [Clostridium thermobutyricum]OPX47420.1 UDP-N-acetyl-alpha-D-glucosamine C6 dehydratase [Clostridium thermobutyricum DSM 4928]
MRENLKGRVLILMLIDTLCINIAFILSYIFKYGLGEGINEFRNDMSFISLGIIIYIISLSLFNMYKSVWRIAGIDEGIKGIGAITIGTSIILLFAILGKNILVENVILSGIITFLLVIGIRFSFRVIRRIAIYGQLKIIDRNERVMIIGAGSSGSSIINEMLNNRKLNMIPICIIDDNKSKVGKVLHGIKVVGTRNEIQNVVREEGITTIIIAISTINSEEKRKILEICQKTKAKLKIVPGISEIIEGKVQATQMREVDIKDLLGREEVKLDKEGIKGYIKNKTVLVTGGGGSIGSELCRQIAKHSPKRLIILDIYENNAYDIQNELKRKYSDLDLRTIIASVRDKDRLNKIFAEENINVVFHAAAHKHVPLMENNSEEAIKNNVMGTLNVAECANEYNVERFVLISTDKAVNPTNIMGATKRLCEMIIQGIDKKSKTEFVAVRFGNVLGSNGSVIPLFKKQIAEGGPVTLTHKEITRYFMLIPEAAQLVLQAGAYAEGGEIFILDMGKSVKIYDLAKKLIRLSGYEPEEDIKIEITGLRPGEKLYEELLMDEEGLKSTKNKKIFIGEPSDIDFEDLKREIFILRDVALNKDKEALKMKMKEIVTTYIEPGEEGKESFEDEVAATCEGVKI